MYHCVFCDFYNLILQRYKSTKVVIKFIEKSCSAVNITYEYFYCIFEDSAIFTLILLPQLYRLDTGLLQEMLNTCE